jgi:hypothetical protein
MTRAFVLASAWWDADAGPPRAELLPRTERIAASFSTRILAHVLGHVAARSPMPLHGMPWVLGASDAPHEPPPGPELRRALAPTLGMALVHAGSATVAMALLEALACLVEHEAVLVAFASDAAPPYHEALAVALLLSRMPHASTLVLEAPALRRTSSHLTRSEITHPLHPFMAARAIARAVHVGRPTVETVPSTGADRPDHWRIELSRAF